MGQIKVLLFIWLLLLINPLKSTAQVWELLNPKPHHQWLFDTYFIDKDNGWAVGWAGLILKTTDGGNNWTDESGIYRNTPRLDFYGVYFEDKNNGWLSGQTYNHTTQRDQAWILKTQNGGISWDTILIVTDPDTSFLFNDIYFIDKQNAYVVGHFGVEGNYKPLIYKTTDAGVNWFRCSASISENNFLLFRAYFISEKIGWVCGQIGDESGSCILKTSDGGISWNIQYEKKENKGAIKAIQFYDDKTGWASGTMTNSKNDTIGVCLRTEDGGENWFIDSTIVGGHSNFNTLYFLDKNNGFLGGRTTVENNFAATIYKTSDGGKSWTQSYRMDSRYYENFVGDPYSFRAVHFSDGLNGTFVGVSGVIVSTADGGNTWEHRFSNQIQGTLRDIQFIDSLTGWSNSIANGKLYKTIDGGLNWKEQTYTNDKPNRFDGMFFIDKDTGWIIPQMFRDFLNSPTAYEGQVFKTTDGGESWVFQYKIPGTHYNSNFKCVYFVDSNRGWIVGNYYPLPNENSRKGFILSTTDGGQNWEFNDKITNLTKLDLLSIFFIDESNGWISGNFISNPSTTSGKLIFKTNDGGKSWINTYNEQPPRVGYLNNVFFQDKLNGWVAGAKESIGNLDNEAGLLLKSSDGGLNWKEVSFSDNFWWLNNVKFLDSQKGWIVGNNLDRKGAILFTENGGNNWLTISKLSYAWIYDSYFIKKHTGWAVTSNGAVYKYKYLGIQTGTPSKTEYCTGEAIQVPFFLPEGLREKITFVAQISDSSGSFDYSPVIGKSESDKSGVIDAVIPNDLPPGDYKIRVWFSENHYSIKVVSAPNPKITGPVNVCKGKLVKYFSTFTTENNYKWLVEGGSIIGDSLKNEVEIIWDDPGYGKLSLREFSHRESCYGISEIRVKINADGNIPNLRIDGKTLICYQDSLIQEYVNNDNDVQNVWSVSGGTIIGDSIGSRVRVIWNPGMQNTIFLTQRILNGECSQMIFKLVDVDTSNLSRKIIGDTIVCSKNTIRYEAGAKNGMRYKWRVDNASSISLDTLQFIDVSWDREGLFRIFLDVISPSGCRNTEVLFVNVDLYGAEINGKSEVCRDSTQIHTYHTNIFGLKYEWQVNNGIIIGPNNLDTVKVLWNLRGLKSIRLHLSLPNNCTKILGKSIFFKSPDISLSIPELYFNPTKYFDSTIKIPIHFDEFDCVSDLKNENKVTVVLKILKNFFLPIQKQGINSVIEGEWRVITATTTIGELEDNNFIFDIEGFILIGDKLETPVIIDQLLTDFNLNKLKLKDGKIFLDGVPDVKGLRLISNNSYNLLSIQPNPNNGQFQVKIESIYEQDIIINLINILGDKVYSEKHPLEKGINYINIGSSKLLIGSYLLILSGNNSIQNSRIEIQR